MENKDTKATPPPGQEPPTGSGDTRPNRVSQTQPNSRPRPPVNPALKPRPIDPQVGSTQSIGAGQTIPAPVSHTAPPSSRRRLTGWLGWLILSLVLLVIMLVGGASSGYLSAVSTRNAEAQELTTAGLTEQYYLGLEDLKSGQFELARQRFEYVIRSDPNFPGAADALAQVMQVLLATATPTIVPPTITPTSTPDPRPVQELFNQAQTLVKAGNWNDAIDVLNSLRKADATYQVAQVDRMIYISLRERGELKILDEHNLGGGIYDLTLAERFGPLDFRALTLRNYSRLYLIGSSFWEAMPQYAVYYFSQVASGAPYLTDGSGWTAQARYWQSLIQYGDQFAKAGKWCDAQAQYEQALSILTNDNLIATANNAALECSPPTATLTDTPAATLTASPTLWLSPSATFEPSQTPTPPLETATTSPASVTPSPTIQPATTEAPSPTLPPATTEPAPTPTFTDTPLPPTTEPSPTAETPQTG